ncbi:hypothetical protein DV515_00012555, partial [Chloebia gouldiae]
IKLHKKETELCLKKSKTSDFGIRTQNSITMDQLRRQLDNRNMQLQIMEKALKEIRMECHRQMQCQMAATEEKNESIGRISSLTVQLDMTKEALRKVPEVWQPNRGIWRLLGSLRSGGLSAGERREPLGLAGRKSGSCLASLAAGCRSSSMKE